MPLTFWPGIGGVPGATACAEAGRGAAIAASIRHKEASRQRLLPTRLVIKMVTSFVRIDSSGGYLSPPIVYYIPVSGSRRARWRGRVAGGRRAPGVSGEFWSEGAIAESGGSIDSGGSVGRFRTRVQSDEHLHPGINPCPDDPRPLHFGVCDSRDHLRDRIQFAAVRDRQVPAER
jgi:hypothetical protein